jgi:hypothetical protein
MDDSVLLIIPVALDADVSLHVLVSKGTLHRPALTRDLCIVLLKLFATRNESSLLEEGVGKYQKNNFSH